MPCKEATVKTPTRPSTARAGRSQERPGAAGAGAGRPKSASGGRYIVHKGPGQGTTAFRTVDFAKWNDDVHKTQRYDTFQTPSGLTDGKNELPLFPLCGTSGQGNFRNFNADVNLNDDDWDNGQKLYGIASSPTDTVPPLDGGAVLLSMMQALREELAMSCSELMREVRASVGASLATLHTSVASVSDAISALQQQQEARGQDGDAMLKMIRELKVSQSVDFANVLTAIDEKMAQAQPGLEEVRNAMSERKVEFDTSSITSSILQLKADLDLNFKGHLVAVQKIVRQEIPDMSSITRSVALSRAEQERTGEARFSTMLEAIKQVGDRTVDLSPVLDVVKDIRDSKVDIDFTPVINAIHRTRSEIDLSAGFRMVVQAIQDTRPEIDLRPILQAIQQTKTEVDLKPVIRAVNSIRIPTVDLHPVLDAIEHTRLELLDFSEYYAAIDTMMATHFKSITQELHVFVGDVAEKIQSEVIDLSPVLDSVSELQHLVRLNKPIPVDFAPVVKEIRSLSNGSKGEEKDLSADFAALKKEIANSRPLINMTPVLAAIEESRKEIEGLRAFGQGFAPLHTELSELRDIVKASQMPNAPILCAIRDARPDLQPLLQAVKAGKINVDFPDHFSKVMLGLDCIQGIIQGKKCVQPVEIVSPIADKIERSRASLLSELLLAIKNQRAQ